MSAQFHMLATVQTAATNSENKYDEENKHKRYERTHMVTEQSRIFFYSHEI